MIFSESTKPLNTHAIWYQGDNAVLLMVEGCATLPLAPDFWVCQLFESFADAFGAALRAGLIPSGCIDKIRETPLEQTGFASADWGISRKSSLSGAFPCDMRYVH